MGADVEIYEAPGLSLQLVARAKKYVKHFALSFPAHFWHGSYAYSYLACDLYVHVICVIYGRQDVCAFKLCAKCDRGLPEQAQMCGGRPKLL